MKSQPLVEQSKCSFMCLIKTLLLPLRLTFIWIFSFLLFFGFWETELTWIHEFCQRVFLENLLVVNYLEWNGWTNSNTHSSAKHQIKSNSFCSLGVEIWQFCTEIQCRCSWLYGFNSFLTFLIVHQMPITVQGTEGEKVNKMQSPPLRKSHFKRKTGKWKAYEKNNEKCRDKRKVYEHLLN